MRRPVLVLSILLLPTFAAADGELDPTFGDGGILVIDPHTSADVFLAEVLVQPDDKIVIAATFQAPGGTLNFSVKRLNPDGSDDTTFASGFFRTINFDLDAASTDVVRCASLRPNGAILIGGNASDTGGGGNRVALVQLTNSGTVDTSFAPDGKYSFYPDGLGFVTLSDIDGTSHQDVFRGLGRPSGASPVLDLAIFHQTGVPTALTRSFQNPDGGWSDAWSMTTLKHGRQYFAGSIPSVSESLFDTAILAFDSATGLPDPAFGDQGWQRIKATSSGFTWDSSARTIAHYPGSRVIAAGRATRTAGDDVFVVRVLEDGSPDPSFGTSGQQYMAWSSDGNRADHISDLEVQADGYVVFAGLAEGPNKSYYPVVARVDASGSYDTSGFGQGWRSLPNPTDYAHYYDPPSLAVQSDGNIIVAGTVQPTLGGPNKVYVMRLLSTHIVFTDGFEGGDLTAWSASSP